MKNSDKIILDLCGGTGAWSKPYKDNGYDVRLITLPEYDVRFYSPPENVYGILAAPPCKEFSKARQKNRYMKEAPKRDFNKGMEIVNVCLNIIKLCNPEFWALENPVGYLRKFLGKPLFTFHPWEFGDPWTKKTDIWGNFILPNKKFITQIECLEYLGLEDRNKLKMFFKEQKISAHIRKGKILPSKADMDRTWFSYTGMAEERTAFRAITPQRFAQAFYEANK